MAAHGRPTLPLKLVLLNIKTIFYKLLALGEKSLGAILNSVYLTFYEDTIYRLEVHISTQSRTAAS